MKSLAIIFIFFSNTFSHPVNNNPNQSVFYKYYPYSFSILEKRFKTRNRNGRSTKVEVNKTPVKDKTRNRSGLKEQESTTTLAPSSYPTSFV